MAKSSSTINYNLRPAKNVERKMICEYIKKLSYFDVLENYRYIGLGARYFTDFILFHKEFAITQMISMEIDKFNSKRYEYNKPFDCIKLCFGKTTDIIESKINWDDTTKDIIWLDYDDPLEESMLIDVESCVKRVVSGSLLMVSFNTLLGQENSMETQMEENNEETLRKQRMEALKGKIGELRIPKEIKDTDLDPSVRPKVFYKIFKLSIEKALYEKNSGYLEESDKYSYQQVLFFKYRDGAPMITIGWVFFRNSDKEIFAKCNFSSLEYVRFTDDVYKIDVPNLTYKEISAINKLIPAPSDEYIHEQLPFISKSDISRYCKLYRYFPYYMEIQSL